MRHTRRFSSLLLVAPVLLMLVQIGEGEPLSSSGRPMLGVASAVVVDVKDPEAGGRIKVRFPWLREARETEVWARVSLPLGGNATGLWALPEVDDEVLVGFEHGDLQRPVVLGSLWNGADRPPGDGAPGRLTSPNGHFSITVADTGITLQGPNVVVRIDATDVQVNATNTAISSDGQTSLTSGGATSIGGALVRLNGSGCPPIARVGDLVQFGEFGVIFTGSPTVTSC